MQVESHPVFSFNADLNSQFFVDQVSDDRAVGYRGKYSFLSVVGVNKHANLFVLAPVALLSDRAPDSHTTRTQATARCAQ